MTMKKFANFATTLALGAVCLAVLALAGLRSASEVVAFGTSDAPEEEDFDLDLDSAPDATATRSELLVRAAIANIENLAALSADFEFQANFFEERLSGRGRYEETSIRRARGAANAPPMLESSRFLLHATVERPLKSAAGKDVPDENALDVVCDSDRRTWWRFTSVEGTKSLTQLNIEELENTLAQLDEDERETLRENGVDRACGMNGMPGLGGLPGVLRRIGATYRFDPEPQIVSSEQGREFYKVVGVAKDSFWDLVKMNLEETTVSEEHLQNIPARVEIYFGADWVFPYKIAYFRDDQSHSKSGGAPLFAVTYSSVVRNDPAISLEDFNYVQPQINSERYDAEYLGELIGRDW